MPKSSRLPARPQPLAKSLPPLKTRPQISPEQVMCHPLHHYTPEQWEAIQTKLNMQKKTGSIVPSGSQYASCCQTVRKKGGIVRALQGLCDVHVLSNSQRRGLCIIDDEM